MEKAADKAVEKARQKPFEQAASDMVEKVAVPPVDIHPGAGAAVVSDHVKRQRQTERDFDYHRLLSAISGGKVPAVSL